ncbi:MAG: alpha/beta hydrolase, partial [Bacilli bacterium]|nr:alpha/beta hydrolase [Bacilli bacterium]
MNLKRIFGLYLPLALVASLVIPLTVEVIFSAGNLNLMVRNIFSFEQAIPDFEWEGKEYLDVSYSPDYETDCLDLYVPTSNTKPKLITLIHGGGFLFNDSRSRPCRFLYQYFRAKGYACASINYRLATESTFPGAVEDCKAAIKFLKLNADYYGYDASKMVVWGESAGGY